jgi:hypothetical protein
MHRIHGNKEDFTRIARSHVPHLLKSLASKSEQQQQIAAHSDNGLRERAKDTPADSSAASSAPSRPAFPAPPLPLHSGLRRARYFIPGCSCAFVCMGRYLRVSRVSRVQLLALPYAVDSGSHCLGLQSSCRVSIVTKRNPLRR